MDPLSSQTGTATITLHHYLDQTAVMPTDGTPVSVGITEAGQSARMHFAGAAGDRFSVYARDVTITGCQTWKLSISAPDGKELSSVLPCGETQSFLTPSPCRQAEPTRWSSVARARPLARRPYRCTKSPMRRRR